MKSNPDLFEQDGLEAWIANAEEDPAASEQLDFLADVMAAAERERAQLVPRSPSGALVVLRRRPWILALAASILFLFALGRLLVNREDARAPTLLQMAGAAPRFLDSQLRGPNASDSDALAPQDLARAMASYLHEDWEAASDELETFLLVYPQHGPGHFYLAAAREQLGDLERAEAEYRRAAEATDPLLSEHARLRLALLWFARGELERAREALAALAREEGELARNARAILGELEGR